jgi:glycosyltransferase involved in cell wall biosynthesis
VVAHDAPAETTSAFRAAGVEVITYEQVLAGVPHTDLLHRPQQVFGAGDLNLGRLLSDRLVLTHLDLIAFHNPAYHASQDAWLGHRRMTRIGMAAADAVVFTSAHARADALAEELIDPTRATIAPIGVEPAATATLRQPAGLGGPDPFLLVLGADYAHKNRPFALRLFKALREQHGFPGRLVLAGAHVEHGSTADQERAILEADPELAASVVELGPVPEEEKHWLLGHATALLCPSTYEGYGLTPLEAAAADLPCVFAAVTAHADVLDPQAATITTWDAEASAAAAAGLLRQGEARDRHLALMRSALDRANWPAAAAQLARAYELALSGSYRAAAASAWEQLERELVIADLNEHRLRLEAIVGHGLTLAGHGGLLTPEQQLGLIRVARRPWLARTLLAPFTRIGSLGRHR